MKPIYILLMALSGAIMAGCGSSSGDGNGSNPAIISAENEADLARAAASAVSQAVAIDDTSDSFGPSLRAGSRSIETVLPASLAGRLAYAPQPFLPCDPGMATIDVSTDGSSGEIRYEQCVLFGITIDGQIIFSSSISGNTTTTSINYNDFTTSFEDVVQSFDFSAVCTSNSATLESSCEFESTITGLDGRTYVISNASVSGSEFSGYTVSVTIEDPDHGVFSIATTTPLTFNCIDGDQPDSGQIQFTDDAGTLVTVTYNDCNGFTVSYSGNSTVYNW